MLQIAAEMKRSSTPSFFVAFDGLIVHVLIFFVVFYLGKQLGLHLHILLALAGNQIH